MKKAVVVGVALVASLVLLGSGCMKPRTFTREEEQKAIAACLKAGEQPVYDQDGSYADCTTNGRLGE